MALRDVTSMTDSAKHRENCRMLKAYCYDQMTLAAAASVLSDIFENSQPFVRTLGPSSNRGMSRLVTFQDYTILLCGGISPSGSQIPAIVQSLVLPEPANFPTEIMDAARRGFDEVAAEFGSTIRNRSFGGGRLVLIGHSWGGAIAAQALPYFGPNYGENVECYTYGTPRFAGAGWDQCFRNKWYVRCMNDDDPVPTFPPHLDQYPNFLGLQGRIIIQRCCSFIHNRAGFLVDNDGNFSIADVSTPDTWGQHVDFATWLSGQSGVLNNAHSLDEYLRRFTVAAARVPPPAPMDAPAVAEPIPDTSTQTVNRVERVAIAMAAVEDTGDEAATAREVVSRVVPVRAERYKAGRYGGLPVVKYAGNVVAYTKNRRQQRSLVRYLNRISPPTP